MDFSKPLKWVAYGIIVTPLTTGIILAGLIYFTKDNREVCYCVIADYADAYQILPQDISGIRDHFTTSLPDCKQADEALDGSDGRADGRVRWYICNGTVCGGKSWPELIVL